MAVAVEPALNVSKHLKFIDPYFNPESTKHLNVFKEVVLRAARTGLHSIEYHIPNKLITERDRTPEFLRTSCTNNLASRTPVGTVVKVVMWDMSSNNREFHDRYLLTDRVGFDFGHGIDEGPIDRDENVKISILDEQMRLELWKRFSINSDYYSLCEDCPPISIDGEYVG